MGIYLNVLNEAKVSAECTHNPPRGIKSAQATAAWIYLARHRKYISSTFVDRSIESISPNYTFDVSCQGSVPESI